MTFSCSDSSYFHPSCSFSLTYKCITVHFILKELAVHPISILQLMLKKQDALSYCHFPSSLPSPQFPWSMPTVLPSFQCLGCCGSSFTSSPTDFNTFSLLTSHWTSSLENCLFLWAFQCHSCVNTHITSCLPLPSLTHHYYLSESSLTALSSNSLSFYFF